mmetsp:Transcript_140700/g.366332  ORF Transcript_140700/g.366332 Transcript_140700/m.366332 type:complete len:201 (-) Transcript_140700:69-671(-)
MRNTALRGRSARGDRCRRGSKSAAKGSHCQGHYYAQCPRSASTVRPSCRSARRGRRRRWGRGTRAGGSRTSWCRRRAGPCPPTGSRPPSQWRRPRPRPWRWPSSRRASRSRRRCFGRLPWCCWWSSEPPRAGYAPRSPPPPASRPAPPTPPRPPPPAAVPRLRLLRGPRGWPPEPPRAVAGGRPLAQQPPPSNAPVPAPS